ncbi:MAG: PIN domain-containing protein [Saprospiraceae bacterium]|jgi:predicted nucleic acid-binding protein|nr:PIN domain-containing protein [Saprospiraceae bacterium]
MKRYLFDTNMLLLLLRQDVRWMKLFEQFQLDSAFNFISIVSLGELHSIGLQNNWSQKRLSQIELLRRDFVITDINVEEIVHKYAAIDAFSQGKLKGNPLGNSARNMGKNDLWIAATAACFDLELLTTDSDFNHLTPTFFTAHKIDLAIFQR